jgi:ABC-type multidrug transport system ATPase subunit
MKGNDSHLPKCLAHSMTEADVLSDRISIMKSGQMATQGTPLSLKQKVFQARSYLALVVKMLSL